MSFQELVRRLWCPVMTVRRRAARDLALHYPWLGRPFLWLRRKDLAVLRGRAQALWERGR